MENIKEDDVIKYYNFLNHNKTTELRLIKPRWTEDKSLPPSYFVNNLNEFIDICKRYNGEFNIYAGINPRNGKGKDDKDVSYIFNIGHDIDAHEGGEEAKMIAGQVAIKIAENCSVMGYKEPLIIDSGYGYWVIHHIKPIENTEENVKKIKLFGEYVKEKFEVKGINLDSTVYNPSRIGRVPGTLNLRNKDNFIMSSTINSPDNLEDELLTQYILSLKPKEYKPNHLTSNNNSINSFMDYCLTHEVPKGERHKVISRNMALYISSHPDRELLKEQYCKIQKGSETELDQWLKNIDKYGKDKYPFSIGELVNFTKKYKIPFDWKNTKEYQDWKREIKATSNLKKEIEKEAQAERLNKAIKFFTDKKHLAEQFLKVQPLYYDKSKLWWIWDFENKCWEISDEIDIMNYISNHSEANTINSTEKNEILEALKQVSRLNKPQEVEKTWIQFKDKIIDIYTGEIFDSDPKYFVTNPIPWSLGESEETPNIDRIFNEWVGEDKSKVLYEILAYCLLTDYPISRIFCFIGSGMNGKSKYLDLLRIFVGSNNCCSTELDSLINSRFEVARLHKKLVCQMGETNFGELSKTSMLKKLTGGDLIGFEYKNKNPFEEKNYAKILISTNNLPSTTDKTIGFYRRWMIIDFPNQFNEKKDILLEIPKIEYNNLALKCCNLLKNILDKREFYQEGSIEERTKKYEEKSNPFDKFWNENLIEDSDSYISKKEFSEKLERWCKENRFRIISDVTIAKHMKEKGIETIRRSMDWVEVQYNQERPRYWVWSGIKWKD